MLVNTSDHLLNIWLPVKIKGLFRQVLCNLQHKKTLQSTEALAVAAAIFSIKVGSANKRCPLAAFILTLFDIEWNKIVYTPFWVESSVINSKRFIS